MRVELFPFQTNAVKNLRNTLAYAVDEYNRLGNYQIVAFTAPTGAGKTLIMISLIENILFGNDDYAEQQDAIFVWLSDSPQLNNQSKKKFETKSDKIRLGRCVAIDDSFDKPVLEDGNIYFINTQKLGVNSNLTKNGDNRNYTIWQTLNKTVKEKGDRLYFIIDEAHRGTREGKDTSEANAIMQRFLLGYPDVGLFSPMPVVIGMSATIERFESLTSRTSSVTGSVRRFCKVTPEEVRASGLLKERIIVAHPENNNESVDITVLQAAVDDWMDKRLHWDSYCHDFNVNDVNPILVIQVMPGNNERVSNTDLNACMKAIVDESGIRFRPGEVVHTFSQTGTIRINNLDIQYKDPSDISDDPNVKVVFFKIGLSTGWDCPRAETMMSFSHANDETYIAQLLGRMIRTPLQKRIPEDDVLNDVRLFLPYYNHDSVDNIIQALQDSEGGSLSDFGEENIGGKTYDVLTCLQNAENENGFNREEVRKFINSLGLLNYRKANGSSNDYLARLSKIIHLLSESGLYPGAIKDITRDVVDKICGFIAGLKEQNTYEEKVMQVRQLRLRQHTGDVFNGVIDEDNKYRVYSINSSDIDRQYTFAGKILKDPGFAMAYGARCMEEDLDQFEEDLDVFKIDVILFSNDAQSMAELYSYAEDKFNALYNSYRGQFNALSSSSFRDRFALLSPETEGFVVPTFELPKTIQVVYEPGGYEYNDHLFVNEKTRVATFNFDGWERQTLEEERRRSDFVCWIRNPSRCQWALAVKCIDGNEKKLLYPDFLVVRKVNGNYVVDILEPHTSANADNLYKAKGLAEYAGNNPNIGRVQLIRMENRAGQQHLVRLDMSKLQVRYAVMDLADVNGLDGLFDRFGEYEI